MLKPTFARLQAGRETTQPIVRFGQTPKALGMEKIIEFLARYPPWVILTSGALLLASVAMLVIFKPKARAEEGPRAHRAAAESTTNNAALDGETSPEHGLLADRPGRTG